MESLINYNSVKAGLHRSNFMCIANFFFFFWLTKLIEGGDQCDFRVGPHTPNLWETHLLFFEPFRMKMGYKNINIPKFGVTTIFASRL